MKIKFSYKNTKHEVEYLLWNSFDGFKFSTTLNEKNENLFISSFRSMGVLVIDDFKQKLKDTKPDEE